MRAASFHIVEDEVPGLHFSGVINVPVDISAHARYM